MPALAGDNLVPLIKPHCQEMKIPILFYSSKDEGKLKDLAAIHGIQGYVCKGDIASLHSKVNQCMASGVSLRAGSGGTSRPGKT